MKELNMIKIEEASADDQANMFYDAFTDQIDHYMSHSIRSVVSESISPYEVVGLGKQLMQWQNYHKFCESNNNLGSLGAIPQIALDVITASVGNSILPLLCSIQPLPEEHGVVYWKEMRAQQTSGGYTANDIISSPLQRDKPGDGTLGGNRRTETLDTTVAATLTYTGNLDIAPIRPYRMDILVSTIGYAKDDGQGNLIGFGLSGTINYKTGAWSITFTSDPGNTKDIVATYDTDVDSLAELDRIQAGLSTKDIRAEIWALASDVGAFANFAFQNRFGMSAIDEVAQDLTNELTRILNTKAVKVMINSHASIAGGSTANWTQNVSGVSYAENKLTFVDAFAGAESRLHAQAGANVANRIIAGKTAAAALRGMPDFERASDASQVSVGLYGYYDGIPVIRATGVMSDAKMLVISNAGEYFAAPMVWAPFMPLMVTSTVNSPNNPFKTTQAAGVWGGMTDLIKNLITEIVVVPGP